MFFLFSKLLHFIVMPGFWIVIFWILYFLLKNPRWKKRFKISAILITILFTNTFVFKEFARNWEVDGIKTEDIDYHDVAIVLGGMAEYNNDLNRLSLRRGGDRIWQTIALYQRGKIGKILISGDSGFISERGLNEAKRFRDELIEWGIDKENILIDSLSKNTHQNAVESLKVLKKMNLENSKILLVTSAIHMKRAQGCFEKVGLEIVPFSTDHYTGPKRHYHWDEYIIPSASTLVDWQALTHEWAGYIVYRIKGYC